MNEAPWRRLLSQIRDVCVVPVIGPELLVGGAAGLSRRIAVGRLESLASPLIKVRGRLKSPLQVPGEAGVSVPAYKNGAPDFRGAVVSVQP